MPHQHIVSAFDQELEQLNNLLIQMGGLAEAQISSAIQCIVKRDTELAVEVIRDDDRVDDLDREVETKTTRLIALRQPVAQDLRLIIAAIRMSADIERIADYAVNIAKRAVPLAQSTAAPPIKPIHAIPRMARLVQHMLNDVLNAFTERDAEKAVAVWRADEEVDEMYTSLFRELLTYMMEDPRNITPCTHLLFVAKNLERIGDHITNVAENIYYLVHGTELPQLRQRGGRPEYEVDVGSSETAWPDER